MKDINYYMSLPYTTEVKRVPDPNGDYYFARIEELPGCHTDGTTAAEAVAGLEEVMRDFIEVKLEIGGEIPEPAELPSGKTQIRMPRTLHQQLIIDADRENVSLNQLIVYRLTATTKQGKRLINK
jgi:predicted RNase H-like HicB family nuclease